MPSNSLALVVCLDHSCIYRRIEIKRVDSCKMDAELHMPRSHSSRQKGFPLCPQKCGGSCRLAQNLFLAWGRQVIIRPFWYWWNLSFLLVNRDWKWRKVEGMRRPWSCQFARISDRGESSVGLSDRLVLLLGSIQAFATAEEKPFSYSSCFERFTITPKATLHFLFWQIAHYAWVISS